MTEQQAPNNKGGVKRARGVFPRLQLSKTLELPEKIFEIGMGEPVRRLTVMDRLGKSPDGGASRSLIIASNTGYGLTTGSYNSDFLNLTDNGQRIVSAKTESEKYIAIYDVLFSNELFSGLVSHFKDRGIPDNEVVVDYLVQNYSLSRKDAEAFWIIAKDNLLEFNLVQQFSGKSLIISQDAALELMKQPKKISTEPQGQTISELHDKLPLSHPEDKREKPTHAEPIVPQFTFNIQIVLPENSSLETYDNIFKSIATHLLHRDNG